MWTLAQNPKGSQRATPVKPTIVDPARVGHSQELNSILRLQRTIGNRAVLRLLQSNDEERRVGLTGTVLPSHSDKGESPISRGGIAIQRELPNGTEERPGHGLKTEAGGSKALSKGVMIWTIFSVEKEKAAVASITFVPYKSYRGKPITFLQTVLDKESGQKISAEMPRIDIVTGGAQGYTADDVDPFYGADWDDKTNSWSPEGAPAPFSNQPGGTKDPQGTVDPSAHLYDRPVVFTGHTRMFETVAVVPETTETLGAIKWGVESHKNGVKVLQATDADVDDRPTAGFLVALDRFWAQPPTVGPNPSGVERYDAILDGFMAREVFTPLETASSLNADHMGKLDPIVAAIKKATDPDIFVSIGGFADATEKNPDVTSEARARTVESYLVAQGVPKARIIMAGFYGAAWARYPPSATESRNRRVQVRVHFYKSRQ